MSEPERTMPESPSTPSLKPDSSATSSGARRSRSPVVQGRSKGKIIFAVFLVASGVVLAFLAYFVVYPTPETGIPYPISSQLRIGTSAPIKLFVIDVKQITPTIARVRLVIELTRNSGGALDLMLPLGATFDCPATADCRNFTSIEQSYWIQPFIYTSRPAVADFYVHARNFGVDFDATNAYAAIPDIHLDLSGQQSEEPLVWVGFRIPDASSYDWSTFSTEKLDGADIVWKELLNKGENQGRVTVGVDHSRQAGDTNLTFFAGALIGIAGAAILAGFQEFFHAFDK
jgi:hypothetical protein